MPQSTDPSPVPSLVFGKYQIMKRLAVGGMGEVFLARQHGVAGFDRHVILKSLLPDLAADPKFVESFLDEARVAATLNHPNVVSIYEVGHWEGQYFIAMEFIDGRNLADVRKAAPNGLPVHVTLRIVRDAAAGLDHAHEAVDIHGDAMNVVHRDISPQNIMVRRDGVTKVVDFGIARAANRSTRTATGSVKGKMAYIAPEQLLGRDVDGRADQWALGVVCWEMLTNQRLFRGQNDLEVMQAVLQQPLSQPSSVAPGLPTGVDAVVMRMLEREPERRFASCGEIVSELDQLVDHNSSPKVSGERRVSDFLKTLSGTAAPGGVPGNFFISLRELPVVTSPTTPLRPQTGPGSTATGLAALKRQRTRMLLIAAAATAAVVFIGGGLFFALRPPPAPPAPVRVEAAAVPAPAAKTTATLTLRSEPAGALVEVDGEALGATPLSKELPPGKHVLKLSQSGYAPLETRVELEAGGSRELLIPLGALPAAAVPAPVAAATPAPHAQHPAQRHPGTAASPAAATPAPAPAPATAETSGFLSLSTEPWTQASVDGEPFGTTPLYRQRLASGTHELVLVNPGAGVNQKRTIKIEPGQTLKLNLKL
jgi:serine/threonine protein kinase